MYNLSKKSFSRCINRNPRKLGKNPRQLGNSPRLLGNSPRQLKAKAKAQALQDAQKQALQPQAQGLQLDLPLFDAKGLPLILPAIDAQGLPLVQPLLQPLSQVKKKNPRFIYTEKYLTSWANRLLYTAWAKMEGIKQPPGPAAPAAPAAVPAGPAAYPRNIYREIRLENNRRSRTEIQKIISDTIEKLRR